MEKTKKTTTVGTKTVKSAKAATKSETKVVVAEKSVKASVAKKSEISEKKTVAKVADSKVITASKEIKSESKTKKNEVKASKNFAHKFDAQKAQLDRASRDFQTEQKVQPRAEVEIPELEKFLNAGSHFGHKSSRWNPKMKKFIYTERNGVHIIDIIQTMKLLKETLKNIQDASDKGNVLIVGTKGQAATAIRKMAEEVGAFYIDTRWPGGLFTNFEVIKRSLDKLMTMEETLARGAEDLVKKEQLLMAREVVRLNAVYSGIKFMDRLPSLMIVIDSRMEKNAIKEARTAGVPVVALLDTNCDPDLVDFPIPSNDDSIRSINLFVELFGQAIVGGRKANSLKSLRRDYYAKLDYTKKAYQEEQERRRAMEEAEKERMKALRSGEKTEKDDSKPVIRISK